MKLSLTNVAVFYITMLFVSCNTDAQIVKLKDKPIVNDTVYDVAKNYKQYQICVGTEVYKGKKNHGKTYCTSWKTVTEYKDGRKDTSWGVAMSGKIFTGDEYEKYQKLSERGKYIVDSLKEDGITQLHSEYLIYESIYMKKGEKVEPLWTILGDKIIIYEYKFWNNGKGNGFELLKETEVN